MGPRRSYSEVLWHEVRERKKKKEVRRTFALFTFFVWGFSLLFFLLILLVLASLSLVEMFYSLLPPNRWFHGSLSQSRVVTGISSCRVNTKSRRGIKSNSWGFLLVLFLFYFPMMVAGENPCPPPPTPPALNESPANGHLMFVPKLG